MENLRYLIEQLVQLPNEVPWVEFKHNNYNPEMIGADISALANSATLHGKSTAYMLWGIKDGTHEIIGTAYDLQNLKKGNQEMENWLRGMLSQNADFEFHSVDMHHKTVGVLIIYGATQRPVTFQKVDYLRVGSYTKKLHEYPELQARLWDKIRGSHFEEQLALHDLTAKDALNLLNYPVYFELMKCALPDNQAGVLHYMIEETFLVKQDNGLYGITNLGAILFAKEFSDFPKVARKSIRVVQYKGKNRLHLLKEYTGVKGYAVGFEGLLGFIEALTPSEEIIQGATRTTQFTYPSLAIREAVANALIHQDFSITGTSPLVELFEDRIEITNPGVPLVDIKRIIDNPPRSRNEKLASLMRRLKMCEELGTGWDKIVISCEFMQLPAPNIELYEDSTKVILFAYKPFSSISQESKLWACYLHACLKYVQGEQLSNRSLRDRFGLKDSASSMISKLIKLAVTQEYIKAFDPDTAPKHMRYIPYWA